MNREELLDMAIAEAKTRDLFDGFCLKDLFYEYEWEQLSLAERMTLGRDFFDPSINPLLESGDFIALDEKTEDGQQQYAYIGRFKNGATTGTITTDEGEEVEVVIATDELEDGASYEVETRYDDPKGGKHLFVMKKDNEDSQSKDSSLPVSFEEGLSFDVKARYMNRSQESDIEDTVNPLQ